MAARRPYSATVDASSTPRTVIPRPDCDGGAVKVVFEMPEAIAERTKDR